MEQTATAPQPKTTKTALYPGGESRSHASGNDIPVKVDGVKDVRVEGGEYKICEGAFYSNEVLDLKDMTNREVLDHIHNDFSCKFHPNIADSGDFVICKRTVSDPEVKKSRKGTVKQILNEIQSEGGCKVEIAEKVAVGDGGILPAATEDIFVDEETATLIEELLFG